MKLALPVAIGTVLSCGICVTTSAQSTAPALSAKSEQSPSQRLPAITRADLARAYMRIDRVITEHPPQGARLAEINREFDEASLLFFANRFGEAVQRIDALTNSLFSDLPEDARSAVDRRSPVSPVAEPPANAPDLDELRAQNALRLDAIRRRGVVRSQAIESFQARNRLLSSHPSVTNSAQFLATPSELAERLRHELEALERGEDPYVEHDGDLWRVITRKHETVPLRVYAPPGRDRSKKLPLVIVLHGAGGDENMFMEGYGAGAIKRLADERGFVVASPLTYPLAGDATLLDALIEEMSTCYAIDRDRVYLIGHSLGAGAALGLAQMRSNVIAATCCIAGGGVPRSKDIPPTLLFAAELDALAGPGAAERGAQAAARAKADGVPVEYRIMRDWGHTLVVGAALPDAVEWLLQFSKASASPNTPVK